MKILVVDDCPVFRSLFKHTLEKLEIVDFIMFARNGAEALIIANNSDFDLIILDLEMPKVDGFEALPKLKTLLPNTKIIVCSGLTRFDYEAIQKVLSLGAYGVTSKLFQKGMSHELSMENFRNELVPRILKIYESNIRESVSSIVKHSYSNNIIDGILVIHLLEKNREILVYDEGTVTEGLNEISNLINFSRTTNTPICFDDGFNHATNKHFDHVKEIQTSFDNYEYRLRTQFDPAAYGLSLDWVHLSMKRFINNYSIRNILIVGFNRTCCITNASSQLKKYYDMNVFTCEKFLFGHVKESRDTNFKIEDSTSINDREVREYLKRNASQKNSRLLKYTA